MCEDFLFFVSLGPKAESIKITLRIPKLDHPKPELSVPVSEKKENTLPSKKAIDVPPKAASKTSDPVTPKGINISESRLVARYCKTKEISS